MMPPGVRTETVHLAQSLPYPRLGLGSGDGLEPDNGDGHGPGIADMSTTQEVLRVSKMVAALEKLRMTEDGNQAWARETGRRLIEYIILGNEIDPIGANIAFRNVWSPFIDEIVYSPELSQAFVSGAEGWFFRDSDPQVYEPEVLQELLARQQNTSVGQRLIALKEKRGEEALAHEVGKTFIAYIKNLGRIDPKDAQRFFQNIRPFIIEVMQDPDLCQYFVGGVKWIFNHECTSRSYNLDAVERIKELRKKQRGSFVRILRAMNGADDDSTWAYQAGSLHSFINSIEHIDLMSAHILLQRLQPLLEEIKRKPGLLRLYAKGLHDKSDPEGILCVGGGVNKDFEPVSPQIRTGSPLELMLGNIRAESGGVACAFETGRSLVTNYLNVDPGIVQILFYDILPFIIEVINSRINVPEDPLEDAPDLCPFFVMGVMIKLNAVAADSPIVERPAEPDILLLERLKRFSGGEWAREVGRTLMYIASCRDIDPEITQRVVSVLRQNIAEILQESESCPESDICWQFAVGVHGGTHPDMNAIIFRDYQLERKVDWGPPDNTPVQDVQSPYFLPQHNSM